MNFSRSRLFIQMVMAISSKGYKFGTAKELFTSNFLHLPSSKLSYILLGSNRPVCLPQI